MLFCNADFVANSLPNRTPKEVRKSASNRRNYGHLLFRVTSGPVLRATLYLQPQSTNNHCNYTTHYVDTRKTQRRRGMPKMRLVHITQTELNW